MNRYFSRALFYTEKSNIENSIASFSFFYVISLINFISQVVSYKYTSYIRVPIDLIEYTNSFSFLFLFFCIISIINSYMQKDKKYYFMLTQPYSRDSIILTKGLSVLAGFIIPTVIYGIASFIILVISKSFIPYIDNNFIEIIKQLSIKLFSIISVLTFITLLIQFMQTLFGNAVAAFLIPPALYFAACGVMAMIGEFLTVKLSFLRNFFHSAAYSLINFIQLIYYWDKYPLITSILLILISAAMGYATLLLNRKIKAENTSELFLFNICEVIFKVIFSMLITLAGSIALIALIALLISLVAGFSFSDNFIANLGTSEKINIEQILIILYNLAWIPLFALVYKLMTKIINKWRAV